MTLVQLGYFGDPAGDLKGILLDAWDDNRAWCKEKKITPAQGRFTPNLVAWQRYAHFCFASHGIHININIYIYQK